VRITLEARGEAELVGEIEGPGERRPVRVLLDPGLRASLSEVPLGALVRIAGALEAARDLYADSSDPSSPVLLTGPHSRALVLLPSA
jgi:hypothetical protein